MKKRTKIICLLAALVVLSILGSVINYIQKEKGEASKTFLLFPVDQSQITSIEISYDGENNLFLRENGIWILQDNPELAIHQDTLNHIAFKLSRITVYKEIEAGEELSSYGLDSCICVVSFSEKATHTLAIGGVAPMDSMRYVSIGDGKIYMVDETIVNEFSYNLDSLMT